jgi:hypothetical protein
MWDILKQKLNQAISDFIPFVKRKRNRKCKWMNYKIKKAIRKRNKKWKKFSETKSYLDLLSYKKERNKVVHEVRTARIKFEQKLADKVHDNPKSFFSYVRSKTRTKDRVGPITDKNGVLVQDGTQMCEVLNDFFSSVYTTENIECIPEVTQVFSGSADQELSDMIFHSDEVLNKMQKLKEGKAAGDDGFIPEFLKKIAPCICEPLATIFNCSMKEGVVPLDWRLANVSPLFKKGSRKDPGNYRPVSLTSYVGKLMESIIKDKIISHLNSFNLIKNSQHGFVAKRSCLSNLLEFLEVVTEYVDKGVPVDAIYLDFQKAFDKVPHERLLKKVEAHGITGKILRWIREWLYDRKQRVVLNGKRSRWTSVLSGVPQGSILGPLLFLIFINDIDEGIINRLLKFADDTKLTGAVGTDDAVNRLQDDLNRLYQWSVDWQMLFNIDKCKVIHFGYNNKEAVYNMGCNTLAAVSEERDLGVIVHRSLKSSSQCVKVVKSANATLGMINRTFVSKNKTTLLHLYKSLVRPKLEYCVQAWRPFLQRDIDLLEKVQRRATRMIVKDENKTYEERLQILNWTTLETRRLRGDLIQTFKILKGLDKVDSSMYFVKSSTGLRGHSLKLFKSGSRLDIRRFFFSQRVVDEWNRLPESAIQCQTVNNFKSKLDLHLYNRGFK